MEGNNLVFILQLCPFGNHIDFKNELTWAWCTNHSCNPSSLERSQVQGQPGRLRKPHLKTKKQQNKTKQNQTNKRRLAGGQLQFFRFSLHL